jgi:hypothetical protein
MPENHHKSSPQHVRTSTRGKGQKLTRAESQILQEKFLRSFSMTANVRAACMQAGIDRSTVRKWEEHDETFSFRYKEAKEDANDLIRAELQRRAIQGYEKPVISVGKIVYDKDGKVLTEKVYSDSLLGLLAKARLPEFRDKQTIDLNATVNGRIDSTNLISIDTRSLTSDQLAKLKALAMEMKGDQQ